VQLAQPVCDIRPEVLPKLPSAQSFGVEAPASQKPPSVHIAHAVSASEPANVPAAHTSQAVAPEALLKEPAAHLVASVAPREQRLPAGQSSQPSCEARLVVLPNVPASQSVGAAAASLQ